MKKALTLILFFWIIILKGQNFIIHKGDTINKIDKNGQKQQIWRIYDPKSPVWLSIRMTNDIQSDTIYYHENNTVKFIYITLNFKITPPRDTAFYFFYEGKESCRGHFTFSKFYSCLTDTSLNGKLKNYILLKTPPVYYGGETAMNDYIQKSVKALHSTEKGSVNVSFGIDEAGRTIKMKVNGSENKNLNEAALKIIADMPRWQPGYQFGALVKVPLDVIIKF